MTCSSRSPRRFSPIVTERRRPISVVAKSARLASRRVRQTAQKKKAVTCVTNLLNSGADHCAKVGDICPADRPMWLTPVAFRFTRPAFHRGRSGYFTFGQREHMPTCKIAMRESVMSHDTDYRLCDLAFSSSIILSDGLAVGLTLFQGGYSIASCLPSPVPAPTTLCLMPDIIPLTRRNSKFKPRRITEARQPVKAISRGS